MLLFSTDVSRGQREDKEKTERGQDEDQAKTKQKQKLSKDQSPCDVFYSAPTLRRRSSLG